MEESVMLRRLCTPAGRGFFGDARCFIFDVWDRSRAVAMDIFEDIAQGLNDLLEVI
jgi:hypothetical protein